MTTKLVEINQTVATITTPFGKLIPQPKLLPRNHQQFPPVSYPCERSLILPHTCMSPGRVHVCVWGTGRATRTRSLSLPPGFPRPPIFHARSAGVWGLRRRAAPNESLARSLTQFLSRLYPQVSHSLSRARPPACMPGVCVRVWPLFSFFVLFVGPRPPPYIYSPFVSGARPAWQWDPHYCDGTHAAKWKLSSLRVAGFSLRGSLGEGCICQGQSKRIFLWTGVLCGLGVVRWGEIIGFGTEYAIRL